MNIFDNYRQNLMIKNLKIKMPHSDFKKEIHGSIKLESKESNSSTWNFSGKTDFDKFIKRYSIVSENEANEKRYWTMVSRGTEQKSGDVAMIIPLIKDKIGRLWLLLQEEARPIDLFRNGKNSRLLAFPAGLIGDENYNESARESAIRELTEETGFVAKSIFSLTSQKSIPTSPGLTDESTNYFLAHIENLMPKSFAMTDGVTKAWWFVPLKNINKWLMTMENNGKIATGQTLTGLMLLKQKTKLKF